MWDDYAREELESEWNAHYDYLSEAYGPTARDAALFAEGEDCAYHMEARERGEMWQLELPIPMPAPLDDIPF